MPVGDTMDRNTLNANVRTEIVMPARAKTVYALWAINPTLSYNVNAPAGSNAPGTPASQTVPYNTAAADKSGWAAGDTGKIPGYRFDGWYTAPNGGNKYDFNTPLTGNVTVYAHWVGNGYTVRFAGNGATGGGTPDQAFQYNIGQNLHRNGFVRDGYTFTGWKRADNQQAYGDGQWVTNLTTQPNGIVTMVAQWSANEAHIRYNPNPPAGKTAGGNGTPQLGRPHRRHAHHRRERLDDRRVHVRRLGHQPGRRRHEVRAGRQLDGQRDADPVRAVDARPGQPHLRRQRGDRR